MRINTKHQFVYVSTPKVCTHTMYHVLEQHFKDGLIEHGFHCTDIPSSYQHFLRWTVCRNPYTRAVSLWWSGCRLHPPDQYGFRRGCGAADDFTRFIVWLADTSFEEREREPLMKNQTQWIRPVEPVTAVHVENLEQELTQLSFWFPGIKVPRLNTTIEKARTESEREGQPILCPSWRELYRDKAAREALIIWAGGDFERFGYSTELED